MPSDPSNTWRIEHITIITPPAEIEDINEAADSVVDSLKNHPATGLVFDLGHVKMFPSLFLAFLLRCHTVAKKHGAVMVLAETPALGLEVLGVTNLDRLWNNYPTRAEALQALAKLKPPSTENPK